MNLEQYVFDSLYAMAIHNEADETDLIFLLIIYEIISPSPNPYIKEIS